MISVSNDFKNCIKNENREIYGYVDVKYQNKSYEEEITQKPTILNIIKDEGLVYGNKTMIKYATLENNYTLLDGTFMVWNENKQINNGFISNALFEDIQDNTIIITNNSTTVSSKGITIYFAENLPFDFTVTITDINNKVIIDNVSNNQSYIYQYIFVDDIIVSTIELNISSIEFPDNRLRIAYVDFNLGDLYQGNELISFDVTEELDLLMEKIPTNTCKIKLNNYPNSYGGNRFDVINPQGIVKYLTNDTILEPYIGVLTEEHGIEYVKMGQFYLKDWSSNSDGNVTINGVSNIGKLKDISMTSDGNFLHKFFNGMNLSNKLETLTGLKFNVPIAKNILGTSTLYIWNIALKKTGWVNYLQSAFSFQMLTAFNGDPIITHKFYDSRDNVTTFDEINNTPVDKISQKELTKDVDFQINSIINTLEVSDTQYGTLTPSSETREDVLTTTYTLSNREEYTWYTLSKLTDYETATFSYTVTSGNGTAELIDSNYWLLYVKLSGDIGTTFDITYNGYIYESLPNRKNVYKTDILQGDKISLNYYDYGTRIDHYDWLQKYYFDNNKQYKVKASTIGDPSLVIGDTIAIQTRYNDMNDGYKNITITKQKFTYNGGLSCSIEGLGN